MNLISFQIKDSPEVLNPPKQGLKHMEYLFEILAKTPEVLNPPKQGLKPLSIFALFSILVPEVLNPPKQGLKPYYKRLAVFHSIT